MATVRPFAALRPSSDRAAAVCSVPYDVVSTAEARALAGGNPLSFLHVSRPEIDLPEATDPHADIVYETAGRNFERLRREAPLTMEAAPALYVYRLRMGDHVQTGIAGCCSVDEYDRDIIRKHERTRQDKEDDRTRHMATLRSQTGPVFMTYRAVPAIDALVSEVTAAPPMFDVTAPDGVTHTIWKAPEAATKRLSELFGGVPLLYIADGHHRAASASRARALLKTDESGSFLSVVFPSNQLRILAYNRVVKDLSGRTPAKFLAELKASLPVHESAPPEPARRGEVSMYLDGRWHGLTLSPGGEGVRADTASLDVSRLQERVLEPLLGIGDVRTDKRIDFVGGIRGATELSRLVDGGHAAVAFSMHPVSLDDLMAVSDAGGIMPPKSTWFEPKLRDGFLCHMI
ncbi:MAG: DUF1015 domain-containing protein [Candidatus Polarisedimenticolia bacterium]